MGDLLQVVEDAERARAIEARRILAQTVVLASADLSPRTEFYNQAHDKRGRFGETKGGTQKEKAARVADRNDTLKKIGIAIGVATVAAGLVYVAKKKGPYVVDNRPFAQKATGVGKFSEKGLLDAEKAVGKNFVELTGGRSAATVEVGLLQDGRQIVRKTGISRAEGDKEYLTAKLGQALGAPVPNVRRIRGGLIMERAPGSSQGGWGQGPVRRIFQGFGKGSTRKATSASGARELGLLDYVTNQTDRRGANFMVDGGMKPPRVFGIDHSSSFWPQARLNKQFPLTPFADKHVRGRKFPPSEVARIRRQVESLKPEFQRAGRMDWFAKVMERVDSLETGARFDDTGIVEMKIETFQGKDAAMGSGKIGIFFVDTKGNEEAIGSFEVLDGRITRANGEGVAEFLTHVEDGNEALKKYSSWSNGWIVTRLL